MSDILIIFGSAFVALVSGVASGARFKENKFASGFGYLLVSLLILILLSFATYVASRTMALTNITPIIQETVYLVLKKVPDEKGAFLVLFDVEAKNERVAHFAVYPPDGYAETELPDGRTALAVAGRQVIVGDQNNAKFILPVKK